MNKLNKYQTYRVHHILWADPSRTDLKDDYTLKIHESTPQRGMRTAVFQLQKAKNCKIALCVCSLMLPNARDNLKHDMDVLSEKFGESTDNPV